MDGKLAAISDPLGVYRTLKLIYGVCRSKTNERRLI